MSYRYTFLDSMKIDGRWGYRILLGVGADTAVKALYGSHMSPEGILPVNTVTYFTGDNSDATYKAFIEVGDEGLAVPFEFDELELKSPVVITAASEEDKVNFWSDDNVSLASATLPIQILSFEIADDAEPIRWSINRQRRQISLITPDVPVQCTSSFLTKLDLSSLLPLHLRGFYKIADLIAMGATAEYFTPPVVTAQTYVVDY